MLKKFKTRWTYEQDLALVIAAVKDLTFEGVGMECGIKTTQAQGRIDALGLGLLKIRNMRRAGLSPKDILETTSLYAPKEAPPELKAAPAQVTLDDVHNAMLNLLTALDRFHATTSKGESK